MLMRQLGKIVLVVFAAIGAVYVGLLLFFKLDASPRCLHATAMVVASPSAHYFAKVESRSCADEPILTRVSLHKDREERVGSKSYIVFEATSSVQSANGVSSLVPVGLKWLSDSEIQIVHPNGTGVTSGDHVVDGIKVTFRESEPLRP